MAVAVMAYGKGSETQSDPKCNIWQEATMVKKGSFESR